MTKIEEMLADLCPNGVEWKELGEVAEIKNGYAFKSTAYSEEGIRVIRISDVQKGKLSNKDVKYYPFGMEDELANYLLREEDLVMSLTGNVGRVAMISKDILPAGLNQRVACIRPDTSVLVRFLFHYFDQVSFEVEAIQNATGGGQKNLSTRWLSEFKIPIPPLEIQEEIVKILDKFTEYVTELTAELTAELTQRQKQYSFYRDKLLSFGDEVYSVEYKTLGEVLDYEQPTKYIVSSKEYNDNFLIPVLTAGQTFVLGYTNETDGIYNASKDIPVIIFDDFTTAKQWVDFDFKVKSSAMKMLTIKNECVDTVLLRYIWHYLGTISYKPDQHARQWIGTYSKIKIPVPSLDIQSRIVQVLDNFDTVCNDLNIGLPKEIELRQKQYEFFRDKLLTFIAEGVYTDSTVQTRHN